MFTVNSYKCHTYALNTIKNKQVLKYKQLHRRTENEKICFVLKNYSFLLIS